MLPKKMKFLTYKRKREKERNFVTGSLEEKQFKSWQHSNFLGTWKSKNRGSWLRNPKAVVKQLQKILDSDDVHVMTKLKDLSRFHLGYVANLTRALIIKTPQKSYNPRKFHVMLENVNYCFKRTNWKKYFPPFRSPLEAHRILHVLLGILYNMYLAKYKDRTNQKEKGNENGITFVVGQLVIVKVMIEKKSDSSYSYQVRRGLIESIVFDYEISQCIYKVYLLDFGFHLEVSRHFMCPLPKPFNCISPLAIPCSLYGVSPLGAKWCNEAIRHFSELLECHPDSVFVVDIMSNRQARPLIVNINVCNIEVMDKTGQKRRPRIKFATNLTQFMIDSKTGSQWHLFAARPKLMSEAMPSPEDRKKGEKLKLTPPTVSYQDALLMTNINVPHLHKRMPRYVIRMEFKKLFRLRHLSVLQNMKNYLVLQTVDQCHRLKTPCSLKMLKTEEHYGNDHAAPVEEDPK